MYMITVKGGNKYIHVVVMWCHNFFSCTVRHCNDIKPDFGLCSDIKPDFDLCNDIKPDFGVCNDIKPDFGLESYSYMYM